jgi:hypothetical protein
VRDAALVVRGRDQCVRVVAEEEPHGSGAHRAAIACRRRWCAGLLPWHPAGEAAGGFLGRPAPADDAVLREQRGDPAGVVCGVEAPPLDDAPGQLSREL